jgi:hypothetical protein
MRLLPTLLTAPVLLAQAPAPAPSYAQKAKEGLAAITPALMKENPAEAVAKAKALLPEGGKLPFDKTNPVTVSKSIADWRGLLDVHSTIANASLAAGQWEEAKAAAETAKDVAKQLQAEAYQPLTGLRESWAKASAEAAKALEEIKTLEAKADKTPDETARLANLKANEATYKGNVTNAERATSGIDRTLKSLSDQVKDFDPTIKSIEDRLKTEQEELVKFKTKPALSKGIVVSVRKDHANLDSALSYLRRASILDPSNKDAAHCADVLLGKAEDKPEKPAKKAGAKAAPRKKGK